MAHSHCNSCSGEHHHEHGQKHEHHHEHSLKKQLWLIGITVVLLIIAVLIEHFQFSIFNSQLTTWQLLLIYLAPYLLIGHDTLKEAAEGVLHGDAFNAIDTQDETSDALFALNVSAVVFDSRRDAVLRGVVGDFTAGVDKQRQIFVKLFH